MSLDVESKQVKGLMMNRFRQGFPPYYFLSFFSSYI
jgi:hypothetical protein